jgi:hypothetical protein
VITIVDQHRVTFSREILNLGLYKLLKAIRLSTKDSGCLEQMSVKDVARRSGQMVLFTRAGGKKEKQMEMVDLYMLTEMCMKENGLMIRPMELVSILILMVPNTLDAGRKTNNTVKVWRHGPTMPSTTEIM